MKEIMTLMVNSFATECPFHNFDRNKFYKLKTLVGRRLGTVDLLNIDFVKKEKSYVCIKTAD